MTKKRGGASAATTSSAASAKKGTSAPTTTTTTSSSGSTLPSKFEATFRNVIKFYEEKQYKTAIAHAETILKEYPQHGDSLAMKAILTRYLKEQEMNKRPEFNTNFYYGSQGPTNNTTLMVHDKNYKKECYNMVKKALEYVQNKSFICWHVYGLMYKEDFKYKEAITCFLNSLKFNPTNEVQAYRELGNAQVHIRDYKGALDSRRKLMELKPGFGSFWLNFAVVQHLSGNIPGAINTIDKYLTVLFDQNSKDSKTYKFEKSELILYMCQLMFENGQFKECADNLLAKSQFLVDNISVFEMLGECYLKMKQLDNAKKIFLQLLKKNSENYAYYGKYQLACGFETEENRFLINDQMTGETLTKNQELASKLYQMYTTDENLKEFRETSPVLKMIILLLSPISQFKEHLTAFVEPFLFKTIPSLFKTIKIIYKQQPFKISTIEQVMLNRMEQESKNTSSKDPSVLLWILVYLSQHFDAIQQFNKALEYINLAIEHTPTLIELYMIKAKIHKHMLNTEQAALCMEQARVMDLSDRYLNTKATKYWMRHNEIVKADELISIFAKHPKDANAEPSAPTNTKTSLNEESSTDENKSTDAAATENKEEKKEEENKEEDKNLIPIEDSAIYHRNNVHDMQCMWFENECADAHFRKGEIAMATRQYYYTVQHFMEMVEDQFDFHTYSIRKVTLRSYVEMMRYYDKLYSQYFYFHSICGLMNVYLHLLKKKEAENNIPFDSPEAYGTINAAYTSNFQLIDLRKDEDLNGIYLSTKLNIWDELTKYLKQFEEYHPNELLTHIYGVTIYLKSRKFLLASKALKRALELSPLDYRVHLLKIQYLNSVNNFCTANPTDSLVKLLQMDYQKVSAGKSLEELNNEYMTKCEKESASLVLAALAVNSAKAMYLGAAPSVDAILNAVEKSTLRECFIAHAMVSGKNITNRPFKKEDYKISTHIDFALFKDNESQVNFSKQLKEKTEKHFNTTL